MKNILKLMMALLLALTLSIPTTIFAQENVIAQTQEMSGGIEYRDEDGNLVERESEEVDRNELARVGIQDITTVEESTMNPIWYVASGVILVAGIGYFIKKKKTN